VSEFQLGTEPAKEIERDAVHVAFFCGIAEHHIRPGKHVGLKGGKVSMFCDDMIGITDPFRRTEVRPGEKVIVCLYPGTVQGMRHHWQHSAVPDIAQEFKELHEKPQKAASVAWIKAQCEDLGVTYDELMDPACEIVNGDYIRNSLNESSRDHWYSIEDEFWKHYELVTGRSVPTRLRGGFTCSC